jgi:hypothetical protein
MVGATPGGDMSESMDDVLRRILGQTDFAQLIESYKKSSCDIYDYLQEKEGLSETDAYLIALGNIHDMVDAKQINRGIAHVMEAALDEHSGRDYDVVLIGSDDEE